VLLSLHVSELNWFTVYKTVRFTGYLTSIVDGKWIGEALEGNSSRLNRYSHGICLVWLGRIMKELSSPIRFCRPVVFTNNLEFSAYLCLVYWRKSLRANVCIIIFISIVYCL
jgi:hypothetical protein